MVKKIFFSLIIKLFFFFFLFIIVVFSFRYLSKATPIKANIVINTRRIVGFINPNWKALAQGGEEKGVRMLEKVIPEISSLFPRYIRIDHIFDYYDVVSRENNGQLKFNFEKLDQTICDIYHTGAKPFLSLGYMPPALSEDGSLISKPKNWQEWSLLVQKTIERYSGKSTRLCGGVSGKWFENIYYEVWNEPDLETFGKWNLYGGEKDYKILYYYTAVGAASAQNVNHFFLGGPATTALYRNWVLKFLDYIDKNKLRLDFISWHHYSSKPDDFTQDVTNLNYWLSDKKYTRFRFLPKIISEWGYDSNPNPIADTVVGAAYTIASIRNLIEQQVEMGFAFEIKDGLNPSWGILTYNGQKKPRYFALKLLNVLDRAQLDLSGEGTFVKAIASFSYNKISLILVNFDLDNRNTELVPLTFLNLSPGNYKLLQTNLEENTVTSDIVITDSTFKKSIIMPPNTAFAIQLLKQ